MMSERKPSPWGQRDYLVKPITEDELVAVTARVMEGIQGEPERLLVVDADGEYAGYLKASLESAGHYSVLTVGVGYEGLSASQDNPPAAIIIDVDLPDMDGYGLLTAMRSHPDTSHIPLIILSNRELSGDNIEKLGAGVHYLKKATFENGDVIDELVDTLAKSPVTPT